MTAEGQASRGRHPLVEPLAYLLGTWIGVGRGLWSSDYTFTDTLSFSTDGRPMVAFTELTHDADGKPVHQESGYLLAREGGVVHMVLSEPSGITESLTGSSEGTRLELRSIEIGHAPGTSTVTATARRLILEGDELIAETDISINGEPITPHTRSVLRKA